LFDVNIPLIYGEERKSFWQLQEELLEPSDNPFMFAYIASPSIIKHPGPSTLQLTRSDYGRMYQGGSDDDLSSFDVVFHLEQPLNEEYLVSMWNFG
jgi:hypothetical protein